MNRRAAWVIAAYALLATIIVPVYPHFPSPNEFTRWAEAAAIVDFRTFEVTPLLPLLGRDFEDLAVVNGRYFSNKAPGGAFVGLPAYAIARAFVGPPSPRTMRITLDAMRLLAATVPVLILALLFLRIAARLGGAQSTTAVTALLFATPLFAYGMLNFSHALTAMALFAAWALLFVRPSPASDYAAGALIGLAVISEYPAVIAGAVLIAFALRQLPRIIAGGAPFAIALAIYNRLLFGSFFALSSGFERDAAFRRLATHGLFGVGMPDPVIIARLLFDPGRGLFVFSPVFLIGLAAIPRVRRALTARQFWSLVLTPLAILLTSAGYPNWHGGWTVGVRYLVPAMPFLALLLAFAESSWILSLLMGASVAAVVMTSIAFPFVPPNVPVPWGTFAWPMLRHGLIAPNLFHLIAQPLAIAVPFAIVLVAVLLATDRRAFVIAGAVACFAIGVAVPVKPIVAIERAYFEEVAFERDGAIARATPPGMTVKPSFVQRADDARRMPPTSWPF